MKELCLVTYTRSSEGFTKELDKIANEFVKVYSDDFKVVICCEQTFEISEKKYQVELLKIPGTKYRRLITLMEQDDSKYYISIDNDITGNIPELINIVKNMRNGNYEVGWGKIKAKKQKNFISNMVVVDKLLSHNIIRPFLWKIGIGISIPGQAFCIKGDSFRGKLIDLDTFLDDLALGLYVNVNNSKKYIVPVVLGYEEANNTFKGLLNQRKRWAIGYSNILKRVRNQKDYFGKVVIHGVSYHMLWIMNWLIIIGFVAWHWQIAIIYMLLISLLISKQDISMILDALVYQLIFPIFHIKWGITLIKELLK